MLLLGTLREMRQYTRDNCIELMFKHYCFQRFEFALEI